MFIELTNRSKNEKTLVNTQHITFVANECDEDYGLQMIVKIGFSDSYESEIYFKESYEEVKKLLGVK